MTGLRAARIRAGYPTAAQAHAAFAKGKKGREALSLSYWQKLEAGGPRLMHPILIKRLAQFLGCSANDVFAWKGEATTTTTTNTPTTTTKKGQQGNAPGNEAPKLQSRLSPRSPGRGRPTKTKGLGKSRDPKKATTTMVILPHGGNSR